MDLKKPKNSNYAAIVVEIKTLIPLEKCDFVQAAIILGNQVIVGKDIQVGDIGLYFPLECQLSKGYLSANNLYRKAELNVDNTKKGYFEENGRIRCVKFRGYKSEGLFMPLSSLEFIPLNVKGAWSPSEFGVVLGAEFDELEGVEICRKYIINAQKTPGTPGSKNKGKSKTRESKIIDGQFRFHDDTSMLYKNLHKISPDSLISITYKLHGTSAISSYLLCKRHITLREKVGGFLHNIYTNITTFGKQGFALEDKEYDYIYSSRKVIKNPELNPNAQHFYETDIWGIAHNELKEHLQKGMTFYYEIVGYLPNGGMIQKNFDYGYEQPTIMVQDSSSLLYREGIHYGIYIYRITYTNVDGKVFEFSAKNVQDFCKKNGLKAVPQLYYGYAANFSDERLSEENWRAKFLDTIKTLYNEKDCHMCIHDVPEEGCVIRIEGLEFEAYKQKSNRFYELETKNLDKGEVNLEDEN